MKRIFISLVAIMAVSCMSESSKFVTFTEADDPTPVSEASQSAWKSVGRLEATWASADSLYSRSEVPVKSDCKTMVLSGWKGERVSAQFLLYTGTGADAVKCTVNDFKSESSSMPSEIAQARFVRYTLADVGGPDCRCERGPLHAHQLVPDMIDSLKVFNMDSRTVRPVWVTINIPEDAEPGVYETEVVVKAKGAAKITMPVQLEVIDQVLPDYTEWVFHLD